MKKAIWILMMVFIVSLVGCSNKKNTDDTYFYLGQSDSWLVTYTISKVESSYYNSLSIQYIFDENIDNDTEKIGPIEYQLKGNSMEIESSYPQELQGIGYFHVGSRMNADLFKVTFDKQIDLSIQWLEYNESIKLIRQKTNKTKIL